MVAGLYNPSNNETLPVTNQDGEPIETPIIGRVAINGPEAALTTAYVFDHAIGLADPELTMQDDDTLQICLAWTLTAPVVTDYSILVHLTDGENLIAQRDHQPRDGHYPTGVWVPGEVIDYCVSLSMPSAPSARWQLKLGVYDPSTGQRLSVTDNSDNMLPDGTVVFLISDNKDMP